MKHSIFSTAIMLCTGLWLHAQQDKKQQDIQSIKDMCGCYEVSFKYTETFAPEIDYEQKLDYTSSALEWAEMVEESDDKLAIQHLLLVHDTMVIKHWRQDWEYENQDVFYYDKDNTWTFKKLPAQQVAGQWTQKVFQVDDSPRYSGSASWIHHDGKHYWENKTDSPLPRREYTKRDDYNVMKRGNRQIITDYGWMHEQDNDKIIREDGAEDILLVQEKGYNTYTKIPDEKCLKAKEWWAANKDFWASVRDTWEEVYAREGDLTLHPVIEDKPLYVHMRPLEDAKAGKAEISQLINKFIVRENQVSNVQGK